MPQFSKALLLAICFSALSGCGQTGPLYMPNETPPQVEPADAGGTAEQPQEAP